MPADLNLSLMNHNEGTMECLKSFLRDVRGLQYREMDYDTGWAEFVRTAIYGGGLDVSEMGTTWIRDFAAMNALHSFPLADVHRLGGKDAFPPSLWGTGASEQGFVWAIPWMTDLTMVYYRRDLLRQAGVDETDAFSTPENFANTLARLSKTNATSPFVLPTRLSRITIHNLSMWLWHMGTDFVDDSGRRALLNETPARSALRSYLELSYYVTPKARGLFEAEADSFFATGQSAVALSGTWLYQVIQKDILDNIGLAIPLGNAYLGGSSLVIWNSSRMQRQATDLVVRLSSPEVQAVLPATAGLLPARLDVLENHPFSGKTELNKVVVQALKTGRALPNTALWGMIEDRLAKIIESLWSRILVEPEIDLDQLLDKELTPAINRLNVVLSNY